MSGVDDGRPSVAKTQDRFEDVIPALWVDADGWLVHGVEKIEADGTLGPESREGLLTQELHRQVFREVHACQLRRLALCIIGNNGDSRPQRPRGNPES